MKQLYYLYDKLSITHQNAKDLRRRLKWVADRVQKPSYTLEITKNQFDR